MEDNMIYLTFDIDDESLQRWVDVIVNDEKENVHQDINITIESALPNQSLKVKTQEDKDILAEYQVKIGALLTRFGHGYIVQDNYVLNKTYTENDYLKRYGYNFAINSRGGVYLSFYL